MDIGQRAIEEIIPQLQSDDQCMVRTERGIEWWSGNLRQEIWADNPVHGTSPPVSRLQARTDFLKDYSGSEDQKRWLASRMHLSSLCGFVRSRSDPSKLQLASSVYMDESSAEGLQKFFFNVVLLQNFEAHALARSLEESSIPAPDWSQAPSTQVQNRIEDIITLVSSEVCMMGIHDSPYSVMDFEDLSAIAEALRALLTNVESKSIVSEAPFMGRTSLIKMTAHDNHPVYGKGLLCTLSLPVVRQDLVEESLVLNERELTDVNFSHLLGSWFSSKDGLIFCSYFPNSFCEKGLLQEIFVSTFLRARWVAEQVYGDDWDNGGYQLALENKFKLLERFLADRDKD